MLVRKSRQEITSSQADGMVVGMSCLMSYQWPLQVHPTLAKRCCSILDMCAFAARCIQGSRSESSRALSLPDRAQHAACPWQQCLPSLSVGQRRLTRALRPAAGEGLPCSSASCSAAPLSSRRDLASLPFVTVRRSQWGCDAIRSWVGGPASTCAAARQLVAQA